ncbi:MAG: hypothetical protein WKF58_02970 [Ilumatobacteraceae bacterium]
MTRSTCRSPTAATVSGYQQDPRNAREALVEVDEDVDQGADIVMVKPAVAYLDVIADVRASRRRTGCRLPRQR